MNVKAFSYFSIKWVSFSEFFKHTNLHVRNSVARQVEMLASNFAAVTIPHIAAVLQEPLPELSDGLPDI